MTHPQAVRYLFGLQGLGVKLGLANIRRLLAALDQPQRAFPSLLITGTNGKGSVTAMASAALRAAGHRVGTYTSPHLADFSERICVDGHPIAARRIAALASQLEGCIDQLLANRVLRRHPTYFEVVTAMAFLHFARERIDVGVIEVGLGGRYDATNTTEPQVSVVTSVALEHTQYLGNTLEAIAFEKGSIARSGRPLITGVTSGPALGALRARATDLGAHLIIGQRHARTTVVGASRRGLVLDVATRRGPYPRIHLPLAGRHQQRNAAVAISALESLPDALRPSPAVIARGFARTTCPGRLEYVGGRPRLLLDGAHNPAALATLTDFIEEFEADTNRVLLFACMRDKDTRRLRSDLFPLFRAVVVTQVRNPRAESVDHLARLIPPGIEVARVARTGMALRRAQALAGSRGLVVATGSLYLIGELKAQGVGTPHR